MTATKVWRKAKKLPLAQLERLTLARGGHPNRTNGLCALEAVAWLAGEPHSDHPTCTSPVIAAFVRTWNDGLPGQDRTRLLKPLLPQLLNTKASEAVEKRRALMCADWAIRVSMPTWLELAGLTVEAAALRALPEIKAREDVRTAMPVLEAARDKAATAGAAAWDAARDAARAAARAAVGDAVGAAAWAAARDAAWDAVGDAAWAAARTAAWDAAWAAARAAAGKALAPTVALLQQSALSLLQRMIACRTAT